MRTPTHPVRLLTRALADINYAMTRNPDHPGEDALQQADKVITVTIKTLTHDPIEVTCPRCGHTQPIIPFKP